MASIGPRLARSGIRGLGHILSTPFASVSASLARVRERSLPAPRVVWLSGAFLLSGLALGLFISAQTQARTEGASSPSSPLTRPSDRGIVAGTISRLESEQVTLKKEIADLRAELSSVQQADAARKTSLGDLNNEIAAQRLAAGMTTVHGPGLVATFDDSTVRSIPENEDPANYILHDYDLRDILNALWLAGAEAVSVNGERIVSSTSLYCVGTTIIANATRLSPPYEIRTIGDPQALSASLAGSSQMEKFNQRANIYDLPVKIDQSPKVEVPAYNGSFVFKYAKVPGEK
ncbi:MAG: DUF881 domain-containing protein [Chloroflexia bacterium]